MPELILINFIMRKLNQVLFAVATLTFTSCNTQKEEINYQVIPLPQEVVVNQETPFTLQETTKILIRKETNC